MCVLRCENAQARPGLKPQQGRRECSAIQRGSPGTDSGSIEPSSFEAHMMPVAHGATLRYPRLRTAIVLLQIISDGLGIIVADRSAESPNHLGDLGVPHGRIGKR